MATKATPVTEGEFVERLAEVLEVSKSEAKRFVQAFKQQVTEALVSGEKISLSGLVRFEPRYVPAKKAGEMVRNPSTGETAPRAEAVPAKFKAKAVASSSLAKAFPSTSTTAGKALAKQLS